MKLALYITIGLILVLLVGDSHCWAIWTACKGRELLCGETKGTLCRWTKTMCGRRKRSLVGQGSMDVNGEHIQPVPLDIHSWTAKCEGSPEVIDYKCFQLATGTGDNGGTEAAFRSADNNGDGKISKEEFGDAPFLFEGQEPGATIEMRVAAKIAREGLPDEIRDEALKEEEEEREQEGPTARDLHNLEILRRKLVDLQIEEQNNRKK